MIATLEAIEAHLSPLEYTTHLFYATDDAAAVTPPVPYLVLGSASHGAPENMRLAGQDPRTEFDLRVTAVAAVADAPPKILGRVFDLLTPDYKATRIVTASLVIDVSWLRNEVVSNVDRDMTIPRVNRHPSYGVASYRVTSRPA